METWYMAKLLLKIGAIGRASSINVDMTFGSLNGKKLYRIPISQQPIKLNLGLNCEDWLIILLEENIRDLSSWVLLMGEFLKDTKM